MLIKVDLEKTYDRLNWNFIYKILCLLGLPMEFIRIIMECITSVSMQILQNGELIESFSPSKGIRQGDLLSPYIFVLCIEYLNHGINQAVRVRKWKLIRLGCKGIPITHLFFTDDLILLGKASREQVTVINNVLPTFCMSLGEQVNKTKTQSFSLGILLQGRLVRLDRTWVLLS